MGESHDGLGQIYEHQGHMDKALAEYQQAYELDPTIEGLDERLNHAEQAQHRSKKRR